LVGSSQVPSILIQKRKSWNDRWLTLNPTDKGTESNQSDKLVECNIHVKLGMKEHVESGAPSIHAIADYCVLSIYTKTYNKWYVCEFGKQSFC
jgi:hypothetical protein